MALCCTAIFRIRLSSISHLTVGDERCAGVDNWTAFGPATDYFIRKSTLIRRARGAYAQSADIVFSSPQSRGPIWVYSRGFDSIRPRWGVKGDCICPPPQPTRAPLLPRCWYPVPSATVLPSSAARPCPSSIQTPTCCATLPRALTCCTWRATTKTRPLPLALRRRRPIPPACSIFLSTQCCAGRPSFPSRSRLST